MTAIRGDHGRELLIKQASKSLFSSYGMRAKEVDIDFPGLGLRSEPDQEGDDLIIVNGGEAARPEVDEEELEEHCGPMPTTPRFMDSPDDRLIGVLLSMADDYLVHSLLLSRELAQNE